MYKVGTVCPYGLGTKSLASSSHISSHDKMHNCLTPMRVFPTPLSLEITLNALRLAPRTSPSKIGLTVRQPYSGACLKLSNNSSTPSPALREFSIPLRV